MMTRQEVFQGICFLKVINGASSWIGEAQYYKSMNNIIVFVMWVLWLVASVILAISIFGWPLVFGDDWSELSSDLIGKIKL